MMIIEKYINDNYILVKFPDYNYPTFSTYERFIKGTIKNPYDKSIYGFGYMSEGDYQSSENGKVMPYYNVWKNMLQRCYDNKHSIKYPTYKDVTVCEDWHNFQNFAAWYERNYYKIDGERMELDKDILVKGNKIYSPETCIFVPHRVNTLFLKCDSKRGKLPIGVYFDKDKKKYRVSCSDINNKQKRLGRYSTIEEAFQVYKEFKESIIKQVAIEYKDKIPTKLFMAMINYEVEITD
jgi:hypothetical protein